MLQVSALLESEPRQGFFQALPAGSYCFPITTGLVSVTSAMPMPCAFPAILFFYRVGVGVGSKALKQAADQLGFQQKNGIEIGWEESVGLVGDEDRAARGRGWTDPGTSP